MKMASNSMQKTLLAIAVLLSALNSVTAQESEEVVSMRCGLAIDAVFAELDKQAENPVTQQALDSIDDDNGQFICLQADDSKIYVRLQSKQMTAIDNKLLFTVNAKTYRVTRTQYGM